jgi:hypothetical protein
MSPLKSFRSATDGDSATTVWWQSPGRQDRDNIGHSGVNALSLTRIFTRFGGVLDGSNEVAEEEP